MQPTKTSFILLVLTALLLFSSGSTFADPPCTISAHPDFPPFTFRHIDHIDGTAATITAALFTRLNLPFALHYAGPWSRVLEHLKNGGIDCICAIYKSPERERFFNFVETPLIDNTVGIFVQPQDVWKYKTMADLNGKTSGCIISDIYPEELTSYFQSNGVTMECTTSFRQNILKLESGRIDFFPYSKLTAAVKFDAMMKTRVVVSPHYSFSEPLYLATSKATDNGELAKRLNEELLRMKADGTLDKLAQAPPPCTVR